MYPGNACQAEFGTQIADFNKSTTLIINVSAFNRTVVCPIVRDNHANLNGVKSVGVRVSNPNGITLTCRLDTITALGDFVESNSNSTTSNVLTNLPLDINTSTNGGTYSLRCNLPRLGAVHGYRVDEF